MPKVSVIVPVYQTEKFIENCVNSIRGQTLRDLEIILVDDGSPDGCPAICDRLAQQDSRIRVLHTENRGVSAARNLGLETAAGEFVGFVDGDDFIEPDMYQTLYDSACENDSQIVECGYYALQNGKSLDMTKPGRRSYMGGEPALLELINTHTFQYMVWSKIYKRTLTADIRFPLGRRYEDVYFCCDAFLRADRVQYVDRPLYRYRLNAGGFSSDGLKNATLDVLDANQYLIDRCASFPKARHLAQKRQIVTCLDLYPQLKKIRGENWAAAGMEKIEGCLAVNGDFTVNPYTSAQEKEWFSKILANPNRRFYLKEWKRAVRRAAVAAAARFPALMRIYRKKG